MINSGRCLRRPLRWRLKLSAKPCVRSEASKAAFIFIADHQFSFAPGAFAEIHL